MAEAAVRKRENTMTTGIVTKTKILVTEEPLVLHTYATRCWQNVRLSDIFRLRLNSERNDWHEYIGRFNDSCDKASK